MASSLSSSVPPQLAAAGASSLAAAASDTLSLLSKSKVGLSGLALALAGFFGILNVLNPPNAILSAYVLLFGVTLILFSLGAQSELLAKYFGFMYRPNGQLAFLLLAGNLAWCSGLPGFLAAAFTNFVAIGAWYAGAEASGTLPSWLARDGGANANRASATGMVDVDRDELL